jgi:predicted NUDIX family phosphoesterase
LYKYLPSAGEKRLVDAYQIGVGGHINPIDGESSNILEAGMMREWDEEVDFKGSILEKKLVGILKDDSRPVEQVHIGLVYSFAGDSPEISIKETEKMAGEMVDLKNIGEYIKGNDGVWVKIVYKDYLSKLI